MRTIRRVTAALAAVPGAAVLTGDMGLRRAIAAAFLAVVVALVVATPGPAATRGFIDGRIAFDRDGDVWAIDARGSVPDTTPAQLTSGPDADAKPSWSPPMPSC